MYSLMPSALRGSTICPVGGQAAGRRSHVMVKAPPDPSLPGATLARFDGVDCGHTAIIWVCQHGHPVSRAARARNWDEPRRALDGRRATRRLERPWRTSSARPRSDELGGERRGDELAIGSARARARRPSRGARAAQGRREGRVAQIRPTIGVGQAASSLSKESLVSRKIRQIWPVP
jgi:hypothetical protein